MASDGQCRGDGMLPLLQACKHARTGRAEKARMMRAYRGSNPPHERGQGLSSALHRPLVLAGRHRPRQSGRLIHPSSPAPPDPRQVPAAPHPSCSPALGQIRPDICTRIPASAGPTLAVSYGLATGYHYNRNRACREPVHPVPLPGPHADDVPPSPGQASAVCPPDATPCPDGRGTATGHTPPAPCSCRFHPCHAWAFTWRPGPPMQPGQR